MRTFVPSVCVVLLCVFFAGPDLRGQGKGEKKKNQNLQELLANGNQALNAKNYTVAINLFEQAVHFFPKDNGARTSLTKAQKAHHAAQDAFAKDMSKGKIALGKKDFKGALVAFTTAAQELPNEKNSVVTAQNHFAGATALQAAFANLTANNYTDAAQNYAKAFHVLGKEKEVQAPLREVRLALAEARNPAPHYAKDFKAGLSALDHGQLAQAKTSFKSALDLPVDVADKEKAQRYFDGANSLEQAHTGLTSNTPNYFGATNHFQTATAKLGNESHAQKQIAKLKSDLERALDAEITRGNGYLKANDYEHAFLTTKNVQVLSSVLPKSTKAQQFLANFQNKAQLDLRAALDGQSIDVSSFNVTGNNTSSVKLAFKSAKLYTWFVKLPMGTVFQVRDNDFEKQNMVLLQDTVLEVKPGSPVMVSPAAASMIPKNDIPGTRVPLVLAPGATDKNLQAIVNALPASNLDFRSQQFAVWIVMHKNMKSGDMSVGSVPPSSQEIATIRTLFSRVGLDPQDYLALKSN